METTTKLPLASAARTDRSGAASCLLPGFLWLGVWEVHHLVVLLLCLRLPRW